MEDVYRNCASLLVFRKAPESQSEYQILLLHKPRKRDDWQLPQGGVEDGESIAEAALRELKEEADISADILHVSEARYRYDFPASYRIKRPDNVCGQCITFVIAKLVEGQTVRVDEDEINGHVWIAPEKIGQYIEREEYLDVIRRLLSEAERFLKS